MNTLNNSALVLPGETIATFVQNFDEIQPHETVEPSRMKSFAIGPIVCALLSWVGPSSSYRIQEQSQGRFVPAPFGEFPQCRIYGRTYCLDAPGYP
eukprot:maker-scaffold138_size318692-snap-gene-1.11 protein:Tk02752 transcript:maker-scaffold138_size318692-snap-gene-1.11-mRNA-1 annotation:"rec2-related protein"